MKRSWWSICVLICVLIGVSMLAAACGGGGTRKLCAELKSGSNALFDPYAAGSGVTKVRVTMDGLGQYDEAVQDLGPADRSACIEGEFDEGGVNVRVEGFDEDGNVVAFGSANGIGADGDETVSISFRRNVAVMTNQNNDRQAKPASKVYVIDVVKRTLIGETTLPGTNPIGHGVSSRGGDELLVTYDDGMSGFVGALSADTGEWRSFPLMFRQELALGSAGRPIGLVAGGGHVSIVDLDAGTVLHDFVVGGVVRDGVVSAENSRAIVITSATPGVVLVDLSTNCTNGFDTDHCIRALDVVPNPGGVALSSDGVLAFIVSSQTGAVVEMDLRTLETKTMEGNYPAGVGAACFSDEIQSILALERRTDGAGRVHTFVVPVEHAVAADDAVQTNLNPVDLSCDPSGRRAIAVSVGTSTETAGLTVVEASFDAAQDRLNLPVGSSRLYPPDPNDTYQDGDFTLHQRYQPAHVAILNGR